jgi:hypothetical protein
VVGKCSNLRGLLSGNSTGSDLDPKKRVPSDQPSARASLR